MMPRFAVALTAGAMLLMPGAVAARCPGPLAVQILGSGGPIAEGARAGSSAVIWVDGKALALIDAGSGAFVRYGEAGVRFEDHRIIALTHFHADHAADLAAILNSGSFSDRSEPLPIMGPKGSDYFPGMAAHLKALFDPETGAWRYLSGFLDGGDGKPRLVPIEIGGEDEGESGGEAGNAGQDGGAERAFVDADTGFRLTPVAVQHGVVPALAYIAEIRGKTIVFAGDQNEFSEAFVRALAGRRPDILIAHNVIPEGEGQPRGLHRPPSSIGTMAAAIDPRLLVLSHNMQRALVRQAEGEAAIRKSFTGPMVIADDLSCYAL
jgi:ribonuclease BN (tRNA processing enzyme)